MALGSLRALRPSHSRGTPLRLFKRWLMFLLGTLFRARRPLVLPDWGARSYRVLFIRSGCIDDLVLSTGIIKAISGAHPTLAVDVMASTLNAAVLQGNPHVANVIPINKRRPWTYLSAIVGMRRARYDAVVDSMGLSPSLTTAFLMLCSGAPHRIGLAGGGNDAVLTAAMNPIPGAAHYLDRCAALVSAFQTVAQSAQPEIFLTVKESNAGEAYWRCMDSPSAVRGRRRRLLVNVSSSKRARYWPEGKIIAALAQIRQGCADVEMAVVGLPSDMDRMSWIGVGAGAAVIRVRHYRQMMALVAASDFVLTADPSVTLIASAFGKPAVVVFSGRWEEPTCWGQDGTNGEVIWAGGPVESLEIEAVVRAVLELMNSHSPRQDLGEPKVLSDIGMASAPNGICGTAARANGIPVHG